MFYYFLEKNAFSSIRKCNFFQRFCIGISKIKFIYSFIEFINFKNYFTIS